MPKNLPSSARLPGQPDIFLRLPVADFLPFSAALLHIYLALLLLFLAPSKRLPTALAFLLPSLSLANEGTLTDYHRLSVSVVEVSVWRLPFLSFPSYDTPFVRLSPSPFLPS